MSAPILPGANLGVLGGGQLGRMFTLAARRMGYRISVFAPQDDTPAGQIAYREVRAPYDDLAAVEAFARSVDVVTFEFENVPAATAEAAAKHAPLRPAGQLLHTTQNRAREKAALTELGLPVAPYAIVNSLAELEQAAATIGLPAVLKTCAWGYDGHGQRKLQATSELATAWRELGETTCVLEGFIEFEAELSVVGARGLNGQIELYDPVLNRHVNHILDVTLCPAPVSKATHDAALDITRQVLQAFEVVGVLCVELFQLHDGTLLVNEIAPRPHNSGHVTIDVSECCQFEQQVRAVCGLPLGSTQRRAPAAAMVNLLGDVWSDGPPNWAAALSDPGVHLHLYGKDDARPGRKMGHLTVLADTLEQAEQRALAARAALLKTQEVPSWTGA